LISIAIPDSMFLEDETLREKTIKVGEIARSVAIFGVERVYIYRDLSRNAEDDYRTARAIFEYLETPQYLRKRIFGRRKELEYAGLLPPLRIPSHNREYAVEPNEVREGVVVIQNGELMADIGAKTLALVEGRVQDGQRLTLRVTSADPLIVRIADKPVDEYWGFEVRRAPSLARFFTSANFELTVLTSRLGVEVEKMWKEFCEKCSSSQRILVCFGSPEMGIDAILKKENERVSNFPSLYVNTFPCQNVQTVRLEEAILGTLTILNIARQL